MIKESIRNIHADGKELRRFGILVGGILLALGAFALWRGHAWGYAPAGVGVVLLAAGLLAPGTLRLVHKAWMSFALLLGTIMSTLLLGLLFYLVITPLGLVMRLFGRDPMNRRLHSSAVATYWVAREAPGEAVDYEKQF
jgi:hypothetical protein